MQKTKRVFLIHGWDGRPDNHWFPWLTHQLVERDFTVFAPTMPNPAHPNVSEWLAELSRVVGTPDEQTYFVGHSLGCITVLRYIVTLPESIHVGGAVFVAGFSGNLSIPEIAEFYELPFDVALAKKHCSKFVSIASDDDDIVPIAKSREFNNELGGLFVEEHGKGHFCTEDGVTQLPSALNAILEMSGKLKAQSSKP